VEDLLSDLLCQLGCDLQWQSVKFSPKGLQFLKDLGQQMDDRLEVSGVFVFHVYTSGYFA
jgi:hypothetical protein